MTRGSIDSGRRRWPWLAIGGVVLVAMIGWLWWEGVLAADADRDLASLQAELEGKLQELAAQGEPTRPEDLIQPAVPDAENAVIELRQAAMELNEETAAWKAYEKYDGPTTPAPPQLIEILKQIMEENRRSLELVDGAFIKPRVDWQLKFQSPMAGVLLPDLNEQRKLVRLLRAAAIAACEQGDDRQALIRVRQMEFIARCVDRQPVLVSHLVAMGIRSLAAETCCQLALRLGVNATDPATTAELSRLIHELLDDQPAQEGLRLAMRGERVMRVDQLRSLASGKINLQELSAGFNRNQPLKAQEEQKIIRQAINDIAQTLKYDTATIEAAGAVNWPAASAKLATLKPAPAEQGAGHEMLSIMAPTYDRAFQTHFESLARRRLAAVALAVRWYSLEHDGKLPATLEELVPRYLPRVADDPLTIDAAIRYLPDQKIIYSVGRDGIDDGGVSDPQKPNEPDLVVRLTQKPDASQAGAARKD